MSDRSATVIGAGLAGCEAAWQLAERGIHVRLIEMKPHKMSPAHHSEQFAELVCSCAEAVIVVADISFSISCLIVFFNTSFGSIRIL